MNLKNCKMQNLASLENWNLESMEVKTIIFGAVTNEWEIDERIFVKTPTLFIKFQWSKWFWSNCNYQFQTHDHHVLSEHWVIKFSCWCPRPTCQINDIIWNWVRSRKIRTLHVTNYLFLTHIYKFAKTLICYQNFEIMNISDRSRCYCLELVKVVRAHFSNRCVLFMAR